MLRGWPGSAAWWWRVWLLSALGLFVLAGRGCERYVPQFQTFPAVDWLEARPPFDETARIPPAAEIVSGFVFAAPRLALRSGPQAYLPQFLLPGVVVRQVSGIRDAAQLEKVNDIRPSLPDYERVSLRLMVFYRAERAAAWLDLRATQLDLGRQETSDKKHFRTSGPLDGDLAWIEDQASAEDPGLGHSLVVGRRGPLAFEVDAVVRGRGGPVSQQAAELAARSEALAREAAGAWTAWLEAQPYAPPSGPRALANGTVDAPRALAR